MEKLPIYATFGVSHVWLIDRDLQTLEAFENREGRWLMLGALAGPDRVSVEPFDALGIAIKQHRYSAKNIKRRPQGVGLSSGSTGQACFSSVQKQEPPVTGRRFPFVRRVHE